MIEDRTHLPLLLTYAIVLHPIVPSRFSIICYLALYGLPLLYTLLHLENLNDMLGRMTPSYLSLGFGVLILLCASVAVPLFHGTLDFSYVNVILAILRKSLLLVFLLLLTRKEHGCQSCAACFMWYFALSTSLYVIGTCFFLAFPPLKNAWIGFMGSSDYFDRLYASYGYGARFGWSGFSGFRATLDCSISAAFCLTLLSEPEKNSKVGDKAIVAALLICLLGNLFYGRTGVIASAASMAVGLLLYRKVKLSHLLIVVLTVSVAYMLIGTLRGYSRTIDEWFVWATQPFVNLLSTGSFDNYSVSHIINDMIFLPSYETVMLGDGLYTEPGTGLHYMHTDVGFMRQILFWGVWLMVLTYTECIHSIALLGRQYFPLAALLLIQLIVFEFKGEVYYEIMPMSALLSLVAVKMVPQKVSVAYDVQTDTNTFSSEDDIAPKAAVMM